MCFDENTTLPDSAIESGEYCLHRATHHTKGTCNGGEYGDQDFEDFFPVDSHGFGGKG